MIDMGGFAVKQALPGNGIQDLDPFLLLHHAETIYNKDLHARHQGIGPHPHRGFSPVTFVIEGAVHHRDSMGNDQVAKKGEVQWMNAGAGIIHSERPSEEIVHNEKKQEIIQLWINTPSSAKMNPPNYQFLLEKDMPFLISKDKHVKSKIIAGSIKDVENKLIETTSELMIIWGIAKKMGRENFIIPSSYNSMIYLIKGKMETKGGQKIESENLLIMEPSGQNIQLLFKEDSQFLLLSGKPIGEEISQYGPFVMNTKSEILEAMRDFQMGKMGVLIEN